jgi:D-amino peptidase
MLGQAVGRVPLKIFISVDMEGISGLVRWADVVERGIDYPRNRRLLTLEANAAVAGAFEGGAAAVLVEENHGVQDLCNLLMDEIDPRCRVVRGAGRPTATTMSALDEETGVVLLVGHHARAGSFPGIMAHTISYERFSAVRLAGRDVGESELFAIRAGELSVPVGLVSGDQVVIEQLRKRVPDVEAVEVKRALSHVAADVIPPAGAREEIRAAAARAVSRARAGELAPYRGEPAPYEIEVELREPPAEGLCENLERLPEFQRLDERRVGTRAPDMDVGFRRIAYLGYGHVPGLLRY